MNINSWPRHAVAIPVFLAASLATGPAAADAINGAIYTSKSDHSAVNANLYENKVDVYLNGGPSNSGCNGGKLDDGEYYFQVTDPSGKTRLHKLNGNGDGVEKRRMRVTDGVISHNLTGGARPTGATSSCGSLSIRLFPYGDTPNNGGVYKVWITRVTDYLPGCENTVSQSCGHFGFVPGHTKTDNFRVKKQNPPPLGALEAIKFYDANANGQYDDGTDLLLEGWPMTLTSVKQTVDSSKQTDAAGVAGFPNLTPDNDYYVEEGMPDESNWVHSATVYVGYSGGPQNPAGPLTVTANLTTTVMFGNYCTIREPSGGKTLGFWSNKNGFDQLMDGGGLVTEFALLSWYNLRDGSGANFDPDPADYDGYRDWLLGGNATYMGYMLSVQLAAMVLNVEAGFVDANAYYSGASMTVAQLMAAANTALANPSENASVRATRAALKNWLDELNNGALVDVPSPTPCDATFD